MWMARDIIFLWTATVLVALGVHGNFQNDNLSSGESLDWGGDPHPKTPGRRRIIPNLYDRRYSDITWIGTHNSEALRTADNGWSLSGNQYFNLTVQLDSGIRLIQAQGHQDPFGSNQIRLCHYNCALLDGGSLDDYLLTAKKWLGENPDELITFLFVNVGVPIEDWALAFHNTGFDLISYMPPPNQRNGHLPIGDWPTVNDMIRSGKRVVSFLSVGANEYRVPYLLSEFSYMFETSYHNYEPSPTFYCLPDRPFFSPELPPPKRLTLVNHFLYGRLFGVDYPYAKKANFTNAAGFHSGQLGEHLARCRTLYERRPNYVLVDFFNEGDVWAVEHGMNAY